MLLESPLRTALLLPLLAGCLRDAPLPFVGDCAVYPDRTYDYGEIGIGTCLSGPVEMAFVERDDGGHSLLVTNANPYITFSGGSLLSLDWESVDLEAGRNLVTDLAPSALDLPDFAAGLAIDGTLALVTTRLSEEARTRAWYDPVYTVDLTDPTHLAFAEVGDDGGHTVEVQSDPVDVVIESGSKRAFVANRTSHTVSVLDLQTSPIETILPWPEAAVTEADFFDLDLSGSKASLSDITVNDSTLLTDDTWTLTWIAGAWRLWVADDPEEGLRRINTSGNGVYEDSALGVELAVENGGGVVSEILDPTYLPGSTGWMFFADRGSIRYAQTDSYEGEWYFYESALLSGREGEWDASLGGPGLLVNEEGTWLFYDGTDDVDTGIGAALSDDGVTFTRQAGPLLSPTWDHELGGIAQPTVIWDDQERRYRMFYSAYDGATWTIGHATSTDLLTWTSDPEPVFALDGVDVAAPQLDEEVGLFRMWYSRRGADGLWDIGAAESADGYTWEDLGPLDLMAVSADRPPRAAMQAAPTRAFSVEGAYAGTQHLPFAPGGSMALGDYGWTITAAAGFDLDVGAAGSASRGGISVDSVDRDLGRAWTTMWTSGGTPSIGMAVLTADKLTPFVDPILEKDTGFDRDGVHSPTVTRWGDGYLMAYAGDKGGITTIGLATSTDGSTWSRGGQLLGRGEEWDSGQLIPGSFELTSDGALRLWYSGSDGETFEIGSAISTDGKTFARESTSKGYVFGTGAPGDFDDSGVRDPWVVEGTDTEGNAGTHLWYAGYDGDVWRVGYAFRAEGASSFTRATEANNEETRPVVPILDTLFHPSGALRPVMLQTADGTWEGWFSGLMNDDRRVGRLTGQEPDRLHQILHLPTAGDILVFHTTKGDPDTTAIPLDTSIENGDTSGVGLTSMTLDEERGLIYLASKRLPFIMVVDVRDDSNEQTGFQDLNYLDVEAILVVSTASEAVGFREVQPVPGSSRLYALNDQPEGVYIIDASSLDTDREIGEFVPDTAVGWLPSSRGSEMDAGVDTQMSIGPASMLPMPDGHRMVVSNFNTNSLQVYDLTMGPYGELVREIPLVGENPYALALAPDGTHVVFANYSGEVTEVGLAESTLGVLDMDEQSPTYLEVVTWLANH